MPSPGEASGGGLCITPQGASATRPGAGAWPVTSQFPGEPGSPAPGRASALTVLSQVSPADHPALLRDAGRARRELGQTAGPHEAPAEDRRGDLQERDVVNLHPRAVAIMNDDPLHVALLHRRLHRPVASVLDISGPEDQPPLVHLPAGRGPRVARAALRPAEALAALAQSPALGRVPTRTFSPGSSGRPSAATGSSAGCPRRRGTAGCRGR